MTTQESPVVFRTRVVTDILKAIRFEYAQMKLYIYASLKIEFFEYLKVVCPSQNLKNFRLEKTEKFRQNESKNKH